MLACIPRLILIAIALLLGVAAVLLAGRLPLPTPALSDPTIFERVESFRGNVDAERDRVEQARQELETFAREQNVAELPAALATCRDQLRQAIQRRDAALSSPAAPLGPVDEAVAEQVGRCRDLVYKLDRYTDRLRTYQDRTGRYEGVLNLYNSALIGQARTLGRASQRTQDLGDRIRGWAVERKQADDRWLPIWSGQYYAIEYVAPVVSACAHDVGQAARARELAATPPPRPETTRALDTQVVDAMGRCLEPANAPNAPTKLLTDQDILLYYGGLYADFYSRLDSYAQSLNDEADTDSRAQNPALSWAAYGLLTLSLVLGTGLVIRAAWVGARTDQGWGAPPAA